MIRVKKEKAIVDVELSHVMVTCPECGQKLTDVIYVKGIAMLRIKCRRCKQYINVDLTGV